MLYGTMGLSAIKREERERTCGLELGGKAYFEKLDVN